MQPETPQTGETPVVTDPKTNANPTPVATPAVDPAEVERLRKQAEQAEMRANQLANQLKAKEDAEAEAEAKRLEQQNEYKTLYEQEQARRKEVEAAQEKAAKDAAVKTASDKLFSEYSAEVKKLADNLGLSLTDDDEESVAAFKSKLDNINGTIKAPKVTANNPGVKNPTTDLSAQDFHDIIRDPKKFQEYLQKNYKGISAMMTKNAE